MNEVAQIAAKLMINELMPRWKKLKMEPEDSPFTSADLWAAAMAKHFGILSHHEIRRIMDEILNEQHTS